MYMIIAIMWFILGVVGLISRSDISIIGVCFGLSGLFFMVMEVSFIRVHLIRITSISRRPARKETEGVNNVDQTQQHNL